LLDPLLFSILLAVALALNLTTAAAEAALLSTSMAHLLAYGQPDDPRMGRVALVLRSPGHLQATLDLAQNIWRVSLMALVFIFSYQQPWVLPLPSAVGVTLLVALAAFWLEWVVRLSGQRSTEAWALRLAPYARVLQILLYPLVALPLAFWGIKQDISDGHSSVDELKSLVEAGQRDGVLEQGERRMIRSIFELGDTLVREIMVPRIDILSLDAQTTLTEAVDVLLKTGHTRVPVYEESVDNILGVLYAKDLLRVWREGDTTGSLKELLRPAYFVPEAKKVDELLADMQSERVHMAMVVDEYGGIAGLVTMEDVVEEIVGEIQDEYDLAEESPYHELDDGEYIFLGRVDLDDINEVMGSQLTKDEADTLGGLIFSRLGRVPASGEWVQIDDLLLTVEQVSGRRIRTVRVKRVAPSQFDDQETVSHVDE
jgi:CBS domain containing-hemolysin-like protein